ncbi:unnamed protein product [Owenia fusiformis]|uniref:Uncharacterized protein n=1 Tax=Owenia fusiformis TaxID=6347 RepID=A0A8J1YBH2_OWEFU|nr:unnamed protein product [Owenia fusiformis]
MAAPMEMCFRNLLGFSSKLQFSRPGRYCKISRDYAKFIHRKPVRVVTPIESKPELEPVVKDDFVQKSAKKVVTSQITNKKIGEWKDGEYVGFRTIDSKVHGELKYTKLEEHDKRFGPAIMATKSGRYREKQGVILLEGARLISDAIKGGAQLKQLYFSMPELLEKIPLTKRMKKSLKLYKVQYKHLNVWSDVVTPSGILGIFELPSPGECVRRDEFIVPITVICDNIRDPGNMGTLIRSCAAAGCEKLIATKGCVDVWEPKVLRSAVGAHFRLPIIPNVQHDMVGNYLDQTGQIFIADNREIMKSCQESSF